MDNNLKCKECNKSFSLKKNLYAHSRKFHNIEMVAPKIQNYNCDYCGKKYSKQRYLSEHLQNSHSTRSSKKSTRIICPYDTCEEPLYSFVKLRSHLSEIHQTDVKLEEFTFDTISDFEAWKHDMEQKTVSMYVVDSAKRDLTDGSTKKHFFCHRSWNYRKKGKDLRSIKYLGTNKINRACPSKIEVTTLESDGVSTVKVKFWSTHCGHAHDIGRVRLDKEIKEMVTSKLQQGVTWEHILDDIRDGTVSETQQKVHLLERQDLCNISRVEHITKSTKQHKDDAVSVSLWVDEMKDRMKEDLPSFIQVSQECKPDTNGNIICKAGLIQRLCVTRQISNEDANLVEKKMDDILKILNKTDRIHFKTEEKVNVRKNIDPQLRFYSTKKRRIEKNQIQKPSLHEVNAIREGLKDDNHAVNIHSAFDHTYYNQQ